MGATVTDIIPVGVIAGNVTVAFAVLSYAGTLAVTVVADPHTCPDVQRLVAELQAELDAFTTHGPSA
jgi:diacylglycerol O-acyltransferase / wax synthase